MKISDVVCVSACRTAMGRFGGKLRSINVRDLGTTVISAALERIGIGGGIVDEVVVGHCRQAGNGPNPAKISSVKGGIPQDVHAVTINCACPSGMKAAIIGAQNILLGDISTAMIAGMESMSTIPYLLRTGRWEGFRMGDQTLVDGWNDTRDVVCDMLMGQTAENLVDRYKLSREEQDEFALGSHQKAAKAQAEGWFDDEIIPVVIPATKKRQEEVFDKDEPIRGDTTLEKMARLPAVFKKGGSVTAGNSCGLSDGASGLILMSREKAKELGLRPLFSLLAYSSVGVENAYMGEGPGVAIPKALKKANLDLNDMGLIEVNEAFACQILANERVLSWDRSKLNVHGGAIALGHPTGESGVRILVTLYHALKRMDRELGVASICGGTGVACAMVIKRES
ncbi:MAG: thiolase family protein [Deltaproteobacteria bacterium]|nr:thiolase family protein [Deltaproteobacteria bacterium]